MTKEVIVESFELDHTAVKAPYVRLIGEETGPKGDVISNYDHETPEKVTKKTKEVSSYFNTLGLEKNKSHLISAIIDEEVKAVDGSRVRLLLLDDIEINGITVGKGTYVYALMSNR